mgnify:CR=1 FL=1
MHGKYFFASYYIYYFDFKVLFADFNFENLLKVAGRKNFNVKDLPKYPEVKRDLALLLDDKVTFTEIFNVAGNNVGYLMYNGFTSTYDAQLNDVFANFKSNNVQDLILDLRYNPGGRVNTAILLSSMITGQFNGEVYSTEQWNSDFQEAYNNNDPELLINRFTDNDDGTPLNSLNLNKVYIIATDASASASELVINSLDPYIDVIHIGDFTTGKYQASNTFYDSNNFGRNGANPNHTYAIQPLIYKSLNKVGKTDYFNGLTPDIEIRESYLNLGVIGDSNEKLLAIALSEIENSGKLSQLKTESGPEFKKVWDSNEIIPFGNEMYDERHFDSTKKFTLIHFEVSEYDEPVLEYRVYFTPNAFKSDNLTMPLHKIACGNIISEKNLFL